MNPNVVEDLKGFDWQKIIDYGNSLSDLNDAQLRFAKGLAIEKAVECLSNSDLEYKGEKHRDYYWPKHNVDVELKSIMSQRMYNKSGTIKKLPNVRLNNSMGSNKSVLNPLQVADIVLVVCADGAYAVDKNVILSNAKHHGDGWEVQLTENQVTPVSGCITQQNKYNPDLAQRFRNAIAESISSL